MFVYSSRNCEMGCYGLGVSRILAAAIEVLSSDHEVRWPRVIAPYQVCIIPPKVRVISQTFNVASRVAARPVLLGRRGELLPPHSPFLYACETRRIGKVEEGGLGRSCTPGKPGQCL